MKSETAKIMVILGLGTAVVGTTVKEVLAGHHGPSFYVPLAGALVAVPLLIMSDFQPELTGGLAALIFVSALTYSGEAIATAIKQSTSGPGSGTPAPGTTVAPGAVAITGGPRPNVNEPINQVPVVDATGNPISHLRVV